MAYQTVAGTKGVSDSESKLQAIKLPKSLRGKRFLDIGCSQGYFCRAARERGATRVVGLDHNKESIRIAAEVDAEGLYRGGDWYELLEQLIKEGEMFDVVIHLSAFHYVTDHVRLLSLIQQLLTPAGLFVLECGVAPGGVPKYVDHRRSATSIPYARHLTMPLLERLLSGFAVRKIGQSISQAGDSIPRFVFHCERRHPIVLLVGGDSFTGKSVFAEALATNRSVGHVKTDAIINGLRETPIASIEAAINAHLDKHNGSVDNVGTTILEYSTPEAFGLAVTGILPTCYDLLVVEGEVFSDARLLMAVSDELIQRGFVCWAASRLSQNQHSVYGKNADKVDAKRISLLENEQEFPLEKRSIQDKYVRVRPRDRVIMMAPQGRNHGTPTSVTWALKPRTATRFGCFVRIVGKSRPVEFVAEAFTASQQQEVDSQRDIHKKAACTQSIVVTTNDAYSSLRLDLPQTDENFVVRVTTRMADSEDSSELARAYLSEPALFSEGRHS